MLLKTRFVVLSMLIILSLPTLVLAGTTGKIVGQVIDKASGEGMPGVNVVVLEKSGENLNPTQMGAATDFDGNFMILNVPPGIYAVKASMIGYKVLTQTDIQVSIDLTATIDFEMEETTMEGEEVTVVARRKIVKKDLTARTAVVGSEEIAKAPVEEIEDILATQAGVTRGSGGDIHIRGGRSGEVAYWIDGVSVTDSYSGNIAVEVENTAVKEMQVVSGAFNAEYGQAMSGIINIATKDGGADYHGSFSMYLGDYISSHSYDDFEADEATEDTDKIFMNLGDVSPTSIQNYQLSLDGPILGDKLTFYLTGRYFDTTNHLYGKRVFNPEDVSYETDDPLTGENIWAIVATGDGKLVPMNPYQKYSAQFKTTLKLLESMKLSYNMLWSQAEYQNYDHELKYNPDGSLQRFEDALTNIFKLTHTLSPRTYYDLSATFTNFKYEHYKHENLDDYKIHPDIWDNRPSFSFRTGGEDLSRFERETKTMILKLDATSQVGQHHQFKAGFEARRHNLFYEDMSVVPLRDELGREIYPFRPTILSTSTTSHDMYERKPMELSVYAQDKIEYDDIIVNAGIRFDHFDPDGQILSDPTDPDINHPLKPVNQEASLAERQAYWYEDAATSSQVSPRIGIAYPMSEGGVIHFSYGHFFQIPRFEYMYTNPEFEMNGGSGVTTLMGNAELEPEKTVSYEIGLQQELSEDMGIAVDMYYRDVRDLVSSDKIVETFTGEKYSQYINRDYGNIRGVAFSFTKRYAGLMSASLDYTYQIAEGNASNPQDAFNDAQGDNEPEKQLVPLAWDQRHLLNLVLTFSRSGNWSASVLATLGSGFPYTPSTTEVGSFSENSGRRPSSFNLDIRASKDFKIANFNYTLFLNIYNALDRLNENDVHGDTGRATYSLAEQDAIESAEATGRVAYVNSISEYFRRPTMYSTPRRVQVGMSVSF